MITIIKYSSKASAIIITHLFWALGVLLALVNLIILSILHAISLFLKLHENQTVIILCYKSTRLPSIIKYFQYTPQVFMGHKLYILVENLNFDHFFEKYSWKSRDPAREHVYI